MDEDYFWVFCGDEGKPTLFGPFKNREAAEINVEVCATNGSCEHAHLITRQSLEQVVRALPATAREDGGCIVAPDGHILVTGCTVEADIPAFARFLVLFSLRELCAPR